MRSERVVNRARLTIITVVPEPSRWVLGAVSDALVDIRILCREMERESRILLDAAVQAVTDDVPLITSSVEAAPARRS